MKRQWEDDDKAYWLDVDHIVSGNTELFVKSSLSTVKIYGWIPLYSSMKDDPSNDTEEFEFMPLIMNEDGHLVIMGLKNDEL